jgi:Rrf2 family nitric oxide-sensitive transcriptional repressor
MFSQTLEYALRAVVSLAQHVGKPLTAQNLSELTQVPASYMSKVLQSLGKENIIRATRGIRGGYSLALPACELSILDVINAIEPIKRIRTCPLGIQSHGTNLCPLHHRMDAVLEGAEDAFRKTTVAELLSDTSRGTLLCEARPVPLSILSK